MFGENVRKTHRGFFDLYCSYQINQAKRPQGNFLMNLTERIRITLYRISINKTTS